ncbi:MAG: copper resistance protein CopC [Actinobacteria bacterium]|nr:copper resistance protein CopC [Actinomycetota bacterium]
MSRANLPIMRISLALRASILALALVGWMAAPAFAAPTVLSSDPAEGAEMHEPPGEVTVDFSEPLQESSGMTVTDGCDNKVSEGDARIVGTAMNQLNVVIGAAPHAGTYTVKYVATGVTGTATGEFTFVVHGGTDCDGTGGGHHGGGGGGGGGGHNGGGHGGGGHTGGGDHNGGGGGHDMGGTGTHSMGDGHSMAGGSHAAGMESHEMKNKDMRGYRIGKHNKHPKKDDGPRIEAGGPGAPIATDIPTGSTVAVALGLAILMGLIGGWVLRVSSPS